MVESLEELWAKAEKTRSDLADVLAQLSAEREALKADIAEAHEAIQGLRTAMKEAKEEMRQTGKAEARKHLAKQMRAAAEILAQLSFSDAQTICYQLDLFQADRLRQELSERQLGAAVTTAADLWDLSSSFAKNIPLHARPKSPP